MQYKRTMAKRLAVYTAGMVLLALGLTLNTKATMGVSPLITVPYVVGQFWELDLGNAVFAWYVVFVAIQMLLHWIKGGPERKKLLVVDVLQLPVSLLFTRFMNLFAAVIPEFETAYPGSFMGGLPGRLLVLLAAVAFTGAGAALSLRMRLIANPGDGVVQAVADFAGARTGTSKNCCDISCVALAVVLSLALAGKVYGVGLGTVIAMLGTGRVIALTDRLLGERLDTLLPE